MDRIKERQKAERGMMNKEPAVFHFIIPHSSFVFHPVYPVN
jgi:hypothetical protein